MKIADEIDKNMPVNPRKSSRIDDISLLGYSRNSEGKR